MSQDIPDGTYAMPLNVRISSADFIRYVTTGFRNDFNATLYALASSETLPVAVKVPVVEYFLGTFNGFNDVLKADANRALCHLKHPNARLYDPLLESGVQAGARCQINIALQLRREKLLQADEFDERERPIRHIVDKQVYITIRPHLVSGG
jgi:hypothetical protein